MNTTGIIAEYNPFHNGHQFHLEAARTDTGADFLVVVMSGCYTQRGLPAVMDKFLRARGALEGGADLVLELPLPYATGSAEYFAAGAIALLDRLGVTNSVFFGSECGDIHALRQAADILAREPEKYRAALQNRLSMGVSFPAAQAAALARTCPAGLCGTAAPDSETLLSSPNNRLGIEYIKALTRRNSSIRPVTVSRKGAGYDDSHLCTKENDQGVPLSSALAIRRSLFDQNSCLQVLDHIPPHQHPVYQQEWNRSFPVSPDDFSLLLHYKLLSSTRDSIVSCWDVSSSLADKIYSALPGFSTYMEFCGRLKSRDITHTRISRSLLHILLDIRAAHIEEYISRDYISYARILGLRRSASPLLHAIKENASVPLISKLADASRILPPEALEMLARDITASHIYEAVCARKFRRPMRNEYARELVIL
ncbi:MAG: nucleotidyltransferase family protein [Lachnospiraceae bacterium]|nr:nucleotidyltransferase family protein [Lachnospiraceae bacterium]